MHFEKQELTQCRFTPTSLLPLQRITDSSVPSSSTCKLTRNIYDKGVVFLCQQLLPMLDAKENHEKTMQQCRKSKIEVLRRQPMPQFVTHRGFYIYYEYFLAKNGLSYFYPRYSMIFKTNRQIVKEPQKLLDQGVVYVVNRKRDKEQGSWTANEVRRRLKRGLIKK